MTTLKEAKKACTQASEARERLHADLIAYLADQGFPKEKRIDTDEESDRLCQLAYEYRPEEFLSTRQAYRQAVDQLKRCGLEWIKVHGSSGEVEQYERACALPYNEDNLLVWLLKLPEKEA